MVAQEFMKQKRTLTPSESAGSALIAKEKQQQTAQSAKLFPVESQIVLRNLIRKLENLTFSWDFLIFSLYYHQNITKAGYQSNGILECLVSHTTN